MCDVDSDDVVGFMVLNNIVMSAKGKERETETGMET